MASSSSAGTSGQYARFKCPLCVFQALNIRLVHSSDPRFSVVCGIGGCSNTSKSFSALYQHIYKKHKDSGIIQSRVHRASQQLNCSDEPEISSFNFHDDAFQQGLCI